MATRKAEEPREFWTDFRCPICYNDREPLLYTDCSHKLCKDCMNHMFKLTSGANPVIKCHACRKLLRRKDITPKSREETEIEEEINHRIRLKKEMNETQEDFDTLAEYHDFLEVFEDIIAMQMKPDQRHIGERILDEYRKQKQERKKRKEKRELQALAASTNAVLDLSSVKYPAQIVVSRANTQLDVKNNPVHRRMMYQLGGYDVQRYENKGLTILSDHLKDLSNKAGF